MIMMPSRFSIYSRTPWRPLVVSLVGMSLVVGITEAQPRRDRPIPMKPDGVVLRPNTGIKEPSLDAAWGEYVEVTDAAVRRLADQCFEDERQKLMQDRVLPVIPRDAVGTYWAEVNAAKVKLHDAYTKHSNPLAMKEWVHDVASQIPRRFPEAGEYLFLEDPVSRKGRVIVVSEGQLAQKVNRDGKPVVGKAVPLPAVDAQQRSTLHGLENPLTKRRMNVSIDCLLQTYELNAGDSADYAGRIVPLCSP